MIYYLLKTEIQSKIDMYIHRHVIWLGLFLILYYKSKGMCSWKHARITDTASEGRTGIYQDPSWETDVSSVQADSF